ncbi:hypothetical protein PPTG_06116 [Phytophthora nicotianae INRA-310]|uniref:Uncharacterized protein n=1 Tax=Phytophthora nicotianae (strain INRA-310) TaxID=761204 RepID=W2QXT8_PHYN3|nr:hypothetical protein PPTG_06116 [Phytophthora nicotianae INRA-310]ETN17090.1 hypothetical protein PPTG_06116 [Phytophthora nicotianae INRA-310]
MNLPATSRLYSEALTAAKFADQRLEARARVDYTGSLRRFVEFCKQGRYPNPIQQRFVELPGVIAAYINRLATTNSSQWPAQKFRAALSWHYTRTEMLVGWHPHDRWVVEPTADGQVVPRGNPARSAGITQILAGLSRTYSLHRLPKEKEAAQAVTFVSRWFDHARVSLHHNWRDSDYAFPGLTKICEDQESKKTR